MEEVQMLPTAGRSVVDRLICRSAGGARQPAGVALGLEADRALGRGEVEADDGPRCGQARRLCEELFHLARLPSEGLPDQVGFHTECDGADIGSTLVQKFVQELAKA